MNTKVIKQKMKSVGNIKKITRTMEMVSVAKMKRATIAAHAYRPFIKSAKYILNTLYRDKSTKHILINTKRRVEGLEGEKNRTIVILMAANKGLCGGYNAQVNKALNRSLKDIYGSNINKSNISFITIGKYAERMAKKFNTDIIYSFAKNNINNREACTIVKEIIKRYQDKDNVVDKVLLIHPYIHIGMSYAVSVEQLLPYDNVGVASSAGHSFIPSPYSETGDLPRLTPEGKGATSNASASNNFKYEPDESTIIETVIPIMIEAMITAAALETEAGEHAARMMAMKTATDNAGDLLHDLKLTFNNARQAKITQEIAELSTGA